MVLGGPGTSLGAHRDCRDGDGLEDKASGGRKAVGRAGTLQSPIAAPCLAHVEAAGGRKGVNETTKRRTAGCDHPPAQPSGSVDLSWGDGMPDKAVPLHMERLCW